MGRLSARACSKLLLFGEHSAVYGYSALGVPLPYTLQVHYENKGKASWQIFDLDVAKKTFVLELLAFFESKWAALEKLRGHIRIHSQVPIALGFGSSASLCVAFSRLINQILNLNLDETSIWQIAHEAEKIFHGSPSGVDTGLIVKEYPCYFSIKPSELPLCQMIRHCPDWYLVIGALPRSVAAKQTIQDFKNSLTLNKSLEKYLKELGSISNIAIHEGFNSFKLMGELINRAHKVLDYLGFSNILLNNILELGKSLGANAGKLSGAGRGGAFYFLLETQEQAYEFCAKIQEKIEDKIVQKLEVISLQFKPRSIL